MNEEDLVSSILEYSRTDHLSDPISVPTLLYSNTEYYTKVKGFPLYLVSSYGIVYRIHDGRLLRVKRKINPENGYVSVNLTNEEGQSTLSVHRLVAKHFLSNDDPANKKVIDHIDCNKENNHIENLEWVSQSENIKRTWSDTRHTEEYINSKKE